MGAGFINVLSLLVQERGLKSDEAWLRDRRVGVALHVGVCIKSGGIGTITGMVWPLLMYEHGLKSHKE